MASSAAKTFVLVHGAWHGGWCWRRVSDLLERQGHKVFTPTLTGLGERSPSPVIVGANTLCPFFSSRSETRRQHQPPCHAPCTSTKVFPPVGACAVV